MFGGCVPESGDLGTHLFELHSTPAFGVGAKIRDFSGDPGGRFGSRALGLLDELGFGSGARLSRGCFSYSLRVRLIGATHVFGFFADAVQLGLQSGLGLLTQPRRFERHRASGGFFRGHASVTRRLLAHALGVYLLFGEPGLLGLLPRAIQFCLKPRLGLDTHARDFRFERPRCHFLRRHPRLARGGLEDPFGVDLRLEVRTSGFLGLASHLLELGLQSSVGLRLDPGNFGLERSRR